MPACSIFFEAEAEEKNLMQRPPRSVNEPLFGGRLLGNCLPQGLAAFVVTAAIYAWTLSKGIDKNTVCALVFAAMVAVNIALVFSSRSLNASWQGAWSRQNSVLWWIMLGGSTGLVLVLGIQVLCELFHFSGYTPHILGTGILAACCVLLLSVAVKKMMGTRKY